MDIIKELSIIPQFIAINFISESEDEMLIMKKKKNANSQNNFLIHHNIFI